MFLPIQLLPLYPYPREASLASAEFAVPVLLVAGMTAACIVAVKKNRLWLSVWGYYLVTLLPVIGIVQVGLQPMADRYTYLPSLGPFLLAGLAAAWVASRTDMISGWRRASRSLLAAGIAGIALLALLTVQQIGIWRSTIDLWTGLIAREPERVPEAYFKRGNAFREEGRIAQALADYDRTIALDRSFPQVYINRGALRGSLGRIDLALQDFTAAIALDPSVTTAYSNRAFAFIALGRYPDAMRDLDRVIALDPSSWTSHVSRGRLNLRRGDRERAIADFRIACAAGEREACRELQRMAVVN
jgi:tetratricopeptide (TPR) repeat protein